MYMVTIKTVICKLLYAITSL